MFFTGVKPCWAGFGGRPSLYQSLGVLWRCLIEFPLLFPFSFSFNWTLAPALLPGPFVPSDSAPSVSWGVSRLLIFLL